MRIVGGIHKGRPLHAPKGRDTRPTSDRAREAMFNVLEHLAEGPGLNGANVIDVFAGTGALGLEALSRGANHITFVENNRSALKSLSDNIQTLKAINATTVLSIKASALQDAPQPVDYAFLDAPYDKGLTEPALLALINGNWLAPGAVLMVEIAAQESINLPSQLSVIKEKKYGAAKALFLINQD
ncbi:MAG: 16S rRNA (guanine(966)-N(2))-methyltransferase RsmD [Magnetovibrio sp.]|nr:16S rRNA (guanine(966)-N(2))-methyltransferase RsmD [Magnetovibrio sp.]